MADDRVIVVVVALSVDDLRAGEKSWSVNSYVLPLRDMARYMSHRAVKSCRWLSTIERSTLLAVFLGAGDMCMSCIRTSCRDCFNPLYLTTSTHDTLCTVLCNMTKAFAAPWLTAKSVAANKRFCLNDHCQINPAFISAASSRSICNTRGKPNITPGHSKKSSRTPLKTTGTKVFETKRKIALYHIQRKAAPSSCSYSYSFTLLHYLPPSTP